MPDDVRLSRATWKCRLRAPLLALSLLSTWAAAVLPTSPAEAFGLDDVISDFLYYREALVADGARPRPSATLFLDTSYTQTKDRFDFGSSETMSYGGNVGVLYRLHDFFLVHASFGGFGFNEKVEFDDQDFRFSGRFVEGRLGGNVIYVDSRPLKAWLTLQAGFANHDTDTSDAFWAWRAGPSTTLSWRVGDVLLEPTVGVTFSDTFDRDTKMVTVVGAGFAAKYRGERWRPQINFAYSKVVDPDIRDDGFIQVGPELTYAITPSLLLGIGYTYGTPVDRDLRFDSHTATLRIRWTF